MASRKDVIRILEALEWSGVATGPGSGPHGSGGDGDQFSACPWCGGLERYNSQFIASAVGHTSNCLLGFMIKDGV